MFKKKYNLNSSVFKIIGLLILLGSLFGGLQAQKTWDGGTNRGYPMSFTQSADEIQWSNFILENDWTDGGYSGTTEVTVPGPGTITGGAFSYTSPTFSLTGTISSPTQASGTYSFTNYPITYPIPTSPYFNTYYLNQSGTWQAPPSQSMITITDPNGGEIWEQGTTHNITWFTVGTVGNVLIEYSSNNGSTWDEVIASTANDGTHPWIIPNTPSEECLVRISEAADNDPTDTSNGLFRILGEPVNPYKEVLKAQEFVGGGTAQGFQEDDDFFTRILPFDLPFCGETIASGSTIYISSNGYIDFDSGSNHVKAVPTLAELYENRRIAPLWADLDTNGLAHANEDVYITQSSNQLIIRWRAEFAADENLVNVEVILNKNGRIQFNYGSGNHLTDPFNIYEPVVGVSKGSLSDYHVCTHSGDRTLNNAQTILLIPKWGKDDLLGSWSGQGVWYRNSDTGQFVRLYTQDADMVVAGDLDDDGTDDLIGSWPAYNGVWVRYATGTWERIGPVGLQDLCVGDMNGDSRDDVVGNFSSGVWYRDSVAGTWHQLYTVSSDTLATGDLDNDGTDDLIGSWPIYDGVWVRYATSTWAKIGPIGVNDLSCGDMNGDGQLDPVGSFTTGVWYRDTATSTWKILYSVSANQIVVGDIDGDGSADLMGLWTAYPGTWVRYSTGTWERLGATADFIDKGQMR